MKLFDDLFQGKPSQAEDESDYDVVKVHPKLLIRSLILSDLHSGTGRTNGFALVSMMKHIETDHLRNLILNGDSWDLWKMGVGKVNTLGRVLDKVLYSQDEIRFMRKVLRVSNRIPKEKRHLKTKEANRSDKSAEAVRTQVVIIPGNHDESLRDFVGCRYGNIAIAYDGAIETANGKHYFVTHGDVFDPAMRMKFLGKISTKASAFLTRACMAIDAFRQKSRINRLLDLMRISSRWSLSRQLERVMMEVDRRTYNDRFDRSAIAFIASENRRLLSRSHKGGKKPVFYDGIICGHTHSAADRFIDLPSDVSSAGIPKQVHLFNTGHWTSPPADAAKDLRGEDDPFAPNTGVLETMEGDLRLFRWNSEKGFTIYDPVTEKWCFPSGFVASEVTKRRANNGVRPIPPGFRPRAWKRRSFQAP